MRFLLCFFFHQTTSPSPLDMPRKDCEFFSKIRGIIRIRNRLPGVVITGESIYECEYLRHYSKKFEIVFRMCLFGPGEVV